MGSDLLPTKASPGMTRDELQKRERERRARYRIELDNGDGRPSVNKIKDDPLLALLKEGMR